MSRGLSAAELRFVNLVAARRFTGGPPAGCDAPEAPPGPAADTPFARAAGLCAALLRPGAKVAAARPTALLAVCAQLGLDGFELLAPQGATAGMVAGLAAGEVNAAGFAHWLEDRAVPVGPAP